jgi:hypothetical protein
VANSARTALRAQRYEMHPEMLPPECLRLLQSLQRLLGQPSLHAEDRSHEAACGVHHCATTAATRSPTRGTTPGETAMARPPVDHQHSHGAGAEPVQGLLAGLGCRDFLNGFSDGSEAQSARMTFAAGSLLQDELRHSRLADLVSVMRLEGIPRFIKNHPQELDRLRIVGAVALHEVHSNRVAK